MMLSYDHALQTIYKNKHGKVETSFLFTQQ